MIIFCKWTTDLEKYKQGVVEFSGHKLFHKIVLILCFETVVDFSGNKMLQVRGWYAKIPAMETKHPWSEIESKGCGSWTIDSEWIIYINLVKPWIV